MRLLQLHSDFVAYQPIAKEIREAEENISRSEVRLEELVVSLVAVENGDNESLASIAVNEIESYLAKLKSNRLLIYPYAHLTSDLAPAERALKVIKSIEKVAKERTLEVYRAPFGWTKAFEIKVKGHPLAENYKIITKQAPRSAQVAASSGDRSSNSRETMVSSALGEEEKLASLWCILESDGKLSPVKDYKFKAGDEKLQSLANYEMAKKRSSDAQPAHIR